MAPMRNPHFNLSRKTFLLINSPLAFLTLAVNIFFAFCLVFPPHGRLTLKPPLRMLLSCLAICSVVYCASLPAMYLMEGYKNVEMLAILWATMLYVTHNSMTCYVWLNLLCYIHIVPVRRAFWVWVKRNQMSIIYTALFLDQMVFFFKCVVDAAEVRCIFAPSGPNSTQGECISHVAALKSTSAFFFRGYILSCLCVTGVSSLSTARYLSGHIWNMAKSSNAAGKQRIQSQMRITATGIIQGVFYCLYGSFYLMDTLTAIYSKRAFFSYWVVFTITTFYMMITTVNLAVGQVVFRQRIASIWAAITTLSGVPNRTIDGPTASVEAVDVRVSW